MTHRDSSLQAAKNLYHEAYQEDARISWLSLSREKFDRVIAAGERAATCALERVPASLKAATTLRRPDFAANWQLRVQVLLIFPK